MDGIRVAAFDAHGRYLRCRSCRGASNRAIKLQGSLEGDRYDHRYCEIFLRFEAFTIRTAENHSVSLDEFEQLGEAYWEAFAARREAKDRERESSS
ncbi:MAG: hypothetical protein IPF53_21015 [Blastocatellia bacterium]|nr:hypothetical protein [Blastocatellia bacterium]